MDLSYHKRDVLTLAVPNITLEINKRKKKTLQNDIWKLALLSVMTAAESIPVLNAAASITVDVTILVSELKKYYSALSLDPDSLDKLCEMSGKSLDELKTVLKSPLHQEITKDLVIKLLTSSCFGPAAEYWLGLIPVLGSLTAGPLSFSVVYNTLKCCINELVDDAYSVLLLVLESSV